LLWGNSGDFVRLERAAFERGGLRSYVLFEHHSLGAPASSGDFPLPAGSVFLRLERRGNQVSGFSSPDGVQWQPLMSTQFLPDHARVGVSAVNTASAPFAVRFEGFKLGKP
jgi:regulation of enolase protein 1 (concanavalin A-like superfamily)